MSIVNLTPDQKVPFNQPIVLQFNRFLNPSTVTRQTIRLQDQEGNAFAPSVDYDPVLLQVTLSPASTTSRWLSEGQLYGIVMRASAPGTGGVQAIDLATFAQDTKLDFVAAPAGPVMTEPKMHFCVDVWPFLAKPIETDGGLLGPTPAAFSQGRCAYAGCHGAPQSEFVNCGVDGGCLPQLPAQGLVLDDSEGVKTTAVGRVSHESNVGPRATLAAAPSSTFGVDMPIIDQGTNGAGDPGNSWMLYKLLLGAPSPPNAAQTAGYDYACSGSPFTTDVTFQAGASTVIGPDERARLSNFIPGREMPYPAHPQISEYDGGGVAAAALTIQEMERLRLWIKQGATFDDVSLNRDGTSTCGLCAAPQPDAGMDGGSKDGAPGDASRDAPKDAPRDGTTDGVTDGGIKG